MENNNHKGTELTNVKETWDQNEKNLRAGGESTGASAPEIEATPATELERLVRQEANEYDNSNKEDRILGGERATVNDDETSTDQ